MFELTTILNHTEETSFSYQGAVITMRVYSERITPALQQQIREALQTSEAEAMRTIISEAVESWSLTWQGAPFPPTCENTLRCPVSFIAAAGAAILALWRERMSGARTTAAPTKDVKDSPTAPAKPIRRSSIKRNQHVRDAQEPPAATEG